MAAAAGDLHIDNIAGTIKADQQTNFPFESLCDCLWRVKHVA